MKDLFNEKIKLAFLFIVLAELFSIFAYLLPDFGQISFFVIVLTVLALALIKLEYGVWIMLAELFIGSKGYLFYFSGEGNIISIRLALFLVIISAWLAKFLIKLTKDRQLSNFLRFKKNSYFYYFPPEAGQPLADIISRQRGVSLWLILFLFIAWGLINGFLNHNDFSDIFFDFNGWLYFALIFPLGEIIRKKKDIYTLGAIFLASTVWLSLKTFFLLFAFSHNLAGATFELYKWVRNTGVGEITQIQGGFYRIFFQSHIFILIGLFIFLFLLLDNLANKNKKIISFHFLISTFFFSVILISFSRSFWIGMMVGLLLFYFIILRIYKWKITIRITVFLLMIGVASAGLIFIIVKSPYPRPLSGFKTASLISDRISKTDEPAVSSRWQLLPILWSRIREAPVIGRGFGAVVTYKSKDPRVLEKNINGEYATYAFEWGWLDIWLKLGFLGLLAYLSIIGKIIYDGWKIRDNLIFGLITGVIIISIVSFFSPYTNHPLGIGYLLIASLIVNKMKTDFNLSKTNFDLA